MKSAVIFLLESTQHAITSGNDAKFMCGGMFILYSVIIFLLFRPFSQLNRVIWGERLRSVTAAVVYIFYNKL